MSDYKTFEFDELKTADLLVDALYKSGNRGNAGDDPLSKLVECSNQGGFRYIGQLGNGVKLCVLYSDLADADWPDSIDLESGIFVYYGDNRSPGHELHETNRKGNAILRDAFNALHAGNRNQVPLFLIFTKGPSGRDVFFRGTAVPGSPNYTASEDLTAIWKTKGTQRFQNYKALFTVLDIPTVSKAWIKDVIAGNADSTNAPRVWQQWRKNGKYKPLLAPKSIGHRTKIEQTPQPGVKRDIVQVIIDYFKKHSQREYAFERCAVELAILMDSDIIQCDLTKPWRDGGRDALGIYRVGHGKNSIKVEFALEAKCKNLNSGSGVKETSRLISRLRHRQFGIFVTTSYLHEQAYKEIVADAHPVIVICGADIAEILINAGYSSTDAVKSWLRANF
jgi:hypothetical protein